jgi:hypothetical protein
LESGSTATKQAAESLWAKSSYSITQKEYLKAIYGISKQATFKRYVPRKVVIIDRAVEEMAIESVPYLHTFPFSPNFR